MISPQSQKQIGIKAFNWLDNIGVVQTIDVSVLWDTNSTDFVSVFVDFSNIVAEVDEKLFRDTDVEIMGIFSMGGHRDGVITFGQLSNHAGDLMLYYLRESTKLLLNRTLTSHNL